MRNTVYFPDDVRTALCPNIIGETFRCLHENAPSGAFQETGDTVNKCAGGGGYGFTPMSFNASLSNNFYAGNSVQPSAFQTLMIIKV